MCLSALLEQRLGIMGRILSKGGAAATVTASPYTCMNTITSYAHINSASNVQCYAGCTITCYARETGFNATANSDRRQRDGMITLLNTRLKQLNPAQ